MNILFLTLLDFKTIQEKNIYTDLLREFVKHNHSLYIISPIERKKEKTHIISETNTEIIKLKICNIQKTNLIEKAISTALIESIFRFAVKKFFSKVKFDLMIYYTPPITFCDVISYIKKRYNATTYLLLKDIFPQNAVDIGLLSKSGILYRCFREKEKKLYSLSDKIGCMSKANVNYIIKNNLEINKNKVEICPNSIEVIDKSIDKNAKNHIRNQYKIPTDKIVFIYGGNFGE